jgi:methanogenic corrinoid protein MtbC1
MGTAFRSLENVESGFLPRPTAIDAWPALDRQFNARQTTIRPWAELLKAAIMSEILPALVSAHADSPQQPETKPWRPSPADVTAFTGLIMNDEMEQARAVADRVIVRAGGRDALLQHLLTPAAQLLGEMWEQDECDFMAVSLGVYRLDQIMKETATAGQASAVLGACGRHILLIPALGEQHSFDLGMAADIFREGGWCVRSGPAASRAQLCALVNAEWFDAVGLSASSARALRNLPGTIRALRKASCNPKLFVMAGSHAITGDDDAKHALGADYMAGTAQQALQDVNIFMDATVTAGLHQSMTRLVDRG